MKKEGRLYLDCEFNQMGGDLISMALVESEKVYFYEVLRYFSPKKWVKENVIPKLGKPPIGKNIFKNKLEKFLNKYSSITIVADWPDDIKYFCEALIISPGVMIKTPTVIKFEIIRIDAPSDNPHNALADAMGIKKYLENTK